jgi:hypothetical protein
MKNSGKAALAVRGPIILEKLGDLRQIWPFWIGRAAGERFRCGAFATVCDNLSFMASIRSFLSRLPNAFM